MSFLKNIFKKKPGGTLFGNLLRGVSSAIPIVGGTVLGTGANKIELGQTQTNKQLANQPQTFAGQPATQSADGTYNINQPLPEVSIQSAKEPSPWLKLGGDALSYLGKRSTENMQVGADNKTLWVMGGAIGLLAIVLLTKK